MAGSCRGIVGFLPLCASITGNAVVPDVVFRHVLIDEAGPQNPHIKVAGDINGDGLDDIV